MTDGLLCDEVRNRELIEHYVTGRLENDEAEALELHALACQDCWASIQQGLELRAALSTEPALVAAASPSSKPIWRVRWITALAAAAVLVLSAVTWYAARRESFEPATVLRSTDHELVVRTAWQANGALRVTWPRQPDAAAYRVRLSGSSGRELSNETADPICEWSAADLDGLGEITVRVDAENAAGEVVGSGRWVGPPPVASPR